ncbi:MAG: hypothetical protein RPR40_02010 [Bermanella sp.]
MQDINKARVFWKILSVFSLINIGAWGWVFWQQSHMHIDVYYQAFLSAIYVLVCAFRTFYPRIDLERYCLHDSPLSSIALGRSCATLAEICFSLQWAMMLHGLGVFMQSTWVIMVAYLIVPAIVIAQIFCWYATLTLKHFWHGMEESVWVLTIALTIPCLFVGYLELSGAYKVGMLVGILACIGGLYIMLWMDIPMYLARAKQGKIHGINYLSVSLGIQDAIQRRVATSDWSVWKKEIVWMSSYFTLGVWLSIAMMLIDFSGH